MLWNLIIICGSLLLLAFLLWKELRRKNPSSLKARVAASVIAVASLAFLILPVTVKRNITAAGTSEAILITEGFQQDSVRNFIAKNSGVRLFTISKNLKYSGSVYVADPGLLSQYPLRISTLHIFGYGLGEHELKQFRKMNVIFHPASVANQVTAVDWQQKIISGEPLIIQGSFNNTLTKPVKMLLTGFNTVLDSVMIPANRHTGFQLITVPRHIDKAVYSLLALNERDTLEMNPIPVQVDLPRKMNVLILAASPDFENKFLKNWLTENGYGFAVRTYISKNKYDKLFVNLPVLPLGRMIPSLLEKFDVVISDLAELHALPASDQASLRGYIENRGLGLIIRATATSRPSGYYMSSFPLGEARDSLQHTVKLQGGSTGFGSTLKISQPVYVLSRPGTQPLITEQHRRILVTSKLSGRGKIVVSTIPNSYAWWLSGNTKDYASYWTLLLNNASKKTINDVVWSTASALPKIHLETQVGLLSEEEAVPQVQAGNDVAYFFQNPYLSYAWSARFWPVKSGWHALSHRDSISGWFYSYEPKHWQGVTSHAKIVTTRNYAANASDLERIVSKQTVSVQIPRIYFLILFIITAGFLWFEEKYRNGGAF